jgi:hypothetical protein
MRKPKKRETGGRVYRRPSCQDVCLFCKRHAWWHLQKRMARLLDDPRDDGHMFVPDYALRDQMRLPFATAEVVEMKEKPAPVRDGRASEAANQAIGDPGKKPPARAVEGAKRIDARRRRA